MAEIKHEEIVRAVRLAANIENAALKIAQQEILINRLSAELKEAQSIAEQMLDIVLEKQKAEKGTGRAGSAHHARSGMREAECAERFAYEAVSKIEDAKAKVLGARTTPPNFRPGYELAINISICVIKEVLRDFLNEKTAVKE